MSTFKRLQASPKILIVTAKRVGDALFVTPGIHLLKKHLPKTQLDILALGPTAVDVFTHNPDIGKIHYAKNMSRVKKIANNYAIIVNLMSEMKGYVENLSQEVISIGKPDFEKHRADQVIEFVEDILEINADSSVRKYFLYPEVDEYLKISQLFKKFSINTEQDILIGMQLGCHRVARRGWKFWSKSRHVHAKVWSIENYIQLAKQLYSLNPKIKIILTGSPQEKFFESFFKEECPNVISFIGKTALLELAALMDDLQLLITHDTGTMHVACARNRPLVALFGATPVKFTGPYPASDRNIIIDKGDMTKISVTEVTAAVAKVLMRQPEDVLISEEVIS